MIVFFLPFKGIQSAKSRWPIEGERRKRLLLALFEQNLETVAGIVGRESTYLVTPDPLCLEQFSHYPGILTRGLGLNQDLEEARRLVTAGADFDRLGVLLPDLPSLSGEDVETLVTTSSGTEVTLCPDHKEVGTNAIVLSPPNCLDFCFEGPSYERYQNEAQSQGRTVLTIRRPGLAQDCDLAEDLKKWLEGTSRFGETQAKR